MANHYSKYVGPKLKETLEALHSGAPRERLKLCDEIDVARAMVERNIAIFDKTCVQPPEEGKEISPELKALATTGLRNSLSHVAELVQTHAKVMALATESVPMEGIDFIFVQITRAINKVLIDHPELADKLVEEIKNIRPPDRKTTQIVIS